MTGRLGHSHRRVAGLTTAAFPLTLTGGAEGAPLPLSKRGHISRLTFIYAFLDCRLLSQDTELRDLMFSRLQLQNDAPPSRLNHPRLTPRFTRTRLSASNEGDLTFHTCSPRLLSVRVTP